MSYNILLTQVTSDALQELISNAVRQALHTQQTAQSTAQQEEPRLLTRDEAARFLRVSISTLHRRVKDGDIPTIVMGGRTLFRQSDLEAFIDAQSSSTSGRAR